MKCHFFELGANNEHSDEYWIHYHYTADDVPLVGNETNHAVETF
jgi:hypothetical protein